TKIGVTGALKVMHQLGMRDFTKEIELNGIKKGLESESPILLANSSWLRARFSGMFRSFVSIGTKIKKGMILGTISDPFGDFEKRVIAKTEGYIICSNHSPIVNQGDALFHIGLV
ncbi:MAG: succinylglutamate desuccinylase, partial [Flavobacteriales bacterium CG_4_10_14_0_8_um_filter_32_5]